MDGRRGGGGGWRTNGDGGGGGGCAGEWMTRSVDGELRIPGGTAEGEAEET